MRSETEAKQLPRVGDLSRDQLMEFSMKNVLTSALPAAAVCAFLAAAPAFAQDTVTGAPAGTAPATVEGYGYAPGQPGFGLNGTYEYGYPNAYGYGYAPGYGYGYAPGYNYGWGPFGPVGAFATGLGDIGAGVVGATGAAVGTALGAPASTAQLHRRCHVYRASDGRRICGP
jgi:hypothetical protein